MMSDLVRATEMSPCLTSESFNNSSVGRTSNSSSPVDKGENNSTCKGLNLVKTISEEDLKTHNNNNNNNNEHLYEQHSHPNNNNNREESSTRVMMGPPDVHNDSSMDSEEDADRMEESPVQIRKSPLNGNDDGESGKQPGDYSGCKGRKNSMGTNVKIKPPHELMDEEDCCSENDTMTEAYSDDGEEGKQTVREALLNRSHKAARFLAEVQGLHPYNRHYNHQVRFRFFLVNVSSLVLRSLHF